MKMRRWLFGVVLCFLTGPALAQDQDQPGTFDYYVLAISWSPNWCERTGNARNSPQCANDRDLGWSLHGLWPQYDRGWPSYCDTDAAGPTTAVANRMAEIMGTEGLVRYQWEKHGTCSGLEAPVFFDRARSAYEATALPQAHRKITQLQRLAAAEIEQAFLAANPQLDADQITVSCKEQQIQEVRVCLSKDLTPRACGRDVSRECTLKNAEFHPIP